MTLSPSTDSTTVSRIDAGRIKRIRALSGAMAGLCLFAAVALPAAMLFYWFATPAEALLVDARLPYVSPAAIGPGIRLWAGAIALTPVLVLVWGLAQARRCFQAFMAGRFFTIEAIGGLRGFSLALLASALLQPFAGAVLSVLLSWSGPPGTKALAFNVGSDTLIALLFAGTVAVIAWVMTEAIAIADENSQFI
jgi:hypothetical protein